MVEQLYSTILVLGEASDRCNGPMTGTLVLKAELLLKASSENQQGTTAYLKEKWWGMICGRKKTFTRLSRNSQLGTKGPITAISNY